MMRVSSARAYFEIKMKREPLRGASLVTEVDESHNISNIRFLGQFVEESDSLRGERVRELADVSALYILTLTMGRGLLVRAGRREGIWTGVY